MNKKIEFEDNGTKYILEYNRESVELLERQGFNANEMAEKPMMMLPLAFQGLFYKNHRRVNKKFIDECYDRFTDKEKLVQVISEMISETYDSLMEEKAGDKGNIEWKIV